jgi:hypothetical protein
MVCRLIREERRGLTYARLRGVRSAWGGLVCFLDDDNLPDKDFISNGMALFAEPEVGLAVSSVTPIWEIDPPLSVVRRQHLFATNDYLGEARLNFGGGATIEPTLGAGMWVRRDAFLAAVSCDEPERLLPDRIGKSLVCGGDLELGILIGKAGFQRIYDPTLRIWHQIPARRLATRYVCSLIQGIVRSELTVREKYEHQTYGMAARLKAWLLLLETLLALPVLIIARSDRFREVSFVMADRWARVRGPVRI